MDSCAVCGHVQGEGLQEGDTHMNDFDLDTRIRAAAPRVSSPMGLPDHGARILREARQRRRRKLRIWTASVAASVVLVGGGTVAIAGNGLQTPWGWTADNVYQFPGPNGQTCFAGLVVKPEGVAADAEVVVVAREIVAGLDLDTLDISEAVAELEAENDQPFDDGSPGVLHQTSEEIVQSALFMTVTNLLFTELKDRGLSGPGDKIAVSLFSQAQGCQ